MSPPFRRITSAAALLPLLLLAFVLVPSVHAQQGARVHAEIITILAKEESGAIDARLADMPALRRAPFNTFRSMEIAETSEYDLGVRSPREITLPNGRRLRIELQRRTPDGRFHVKVSINRPNQTDYLPLLQVRAAPGDPFFVVGQRHRGGTLVIGIRLGGSPRAR